MQKLSKEDVVNSKSRLARLKVQKEDKQYFKEEKELEELRRLRLRNNNTKPREPLDEE